MSWFPAQPFPNIISIFAYAFFLWFAIFIFYHSKKKSSIMFSLALTSFSIYVFSVILYSTANDKFIYQAWFKIFLLTSITSALFWLHTTLLLLAEIKTEKEWSSSINENNSFLDKLKYIALGSFNELNLSSRLGITLFYLIGIFLAALGLSGSGIIDVNTIQPANWPWSKWTVFSTQTGPYIKFLMVFRIICFSWSVFNLIIVKERKQVNNTNENHTFNWLILGSLAFAAATVILALRTFYQWPIPRATGHLMFSIGVLIFGYSIAERNAILEKKAIRERFRFEFWTLFPLLTIFILLNVIFISRTSTPFIAIQATFLILIFVFLKRIQSFWEQKFMDPLLSQTKIDVENITAKLPDISRAQLDEWAVLEEKLTEAEKLVFNTVGAGFGKLTYEEIADITYLSHHTVDTHLQRIRVKLKCNKTSELPLIWLALHSLEVKHERKKEKSTKSQPSNILH